MKMILNAELAGDGSVEIRKVVERYDFQADDGTIYPVEESEIVPQGVPVDVTGGGELYAVLIPRSRGLPPRGWLTTEYVDREETVK